MTISNTVTIASIIAGSLIVLIGYLLLVQWHQHQSYRRLVRARMDRLWQMDKLSSLYRMWQPRFLSTSSQEALSLSSVATPGPAERLLKLPHVSQVEMPKDN